MEISVLERQTAALRRIYHDRSAMDSDHHHQLWHSHSSIHQPSPNSKKRKPEQFEIEEEKSDITTRTERETSANTSSKESLKPDYIHVRARRGQATDSHSLAERARREKIGKKMKCLQDLVPGCNKVTGKAGMLDEIINYVQSLQKQVEFLSMKLATVNPSLDSFFAKEIPAYIAAQLEATSFQYNQMQLGMDQILTPKPVGSTSLQIPEVFLDSSCTSVCDFFDSIRLRIPGWESEIYYNS